MFTLSDFFNWLFQTNKVIDDEDVKEKERYVVVFNEFSHKGADDWSIIYRNDIPHKIYSEVLDLSYSIEDAEMIVQFYER